MTQAGKKEEQFLQAVINEHPKAISDLILSYGRYLPSTPQTLFAMYVNYGEGFSEKLDEIDQEEPEVSNVTGNEISNGITAAGHLQNYYDQLRGLKKSTSQNPASNTNKPSTSQTKVTTDKKTVTTVTTYSILGLNISPMLAWGIGITAFLGIVWIVIAVFSKKKA